MFNCFKKSFLIFLLGIGTVPSAYGMENRLQNQASFLGLIGQVIKTVLPSIAAVILVPGLYHCYPKISNYDYTIHSSFLRAHRMSQFPEGSVPAIQQYFAKGHNPNITIGEENGPTPLAIASQCRNYDLVATLLEHKADVNKPDKYGRTPFYFAYERYETDGRFRKRKISDQAEMVKIIEKLLQQGASPNIKIKIGYNRNGTPLIRAIQNQNLYMVKLLVENKADVNASDGYNETPLSAAMETGNFEIIVYLLQKGANLSTISQSQRSNLLLKVLL